MKYSYNWIQKHIEEKLPKPEELQEVIIFHAFEVESLNEIDGDTIMDIKVLPDRASDCLSHYGMAREISGLLNLNLKKLENKDLPNVDLVLPVEIRSNNCSRYITISINNVSVGPSPEWLKKSIESIGQRSINNIVDITNYILQDLGQPVHVFDADKIDGGIIVREAYEGEKIITLSDENKNLNNETIVVADYLGALAIAGIKGGKIAELGNDTKNIVLEIANFNPSNIRKTSQNLFLTTDASKRFENNLSPEGALAAAKYATALIVEIAGGEIVGVKDYHKKQQHQKNITFKVEDIARILGKITNKEISDIFDRYKYNYSFENDVFNLEVPYFRSDILGAHDIAEEIGRVNGYEKITPLGLPFSLDINKNKIFENISSIKNYLINKGFCEVMTSSFQKKGDICVIHGSKDKNYLRCNLSTAIKESYDKNKQNTLLLEVEKIKIFEIGTVFFLMDDKLREEIRVATIDDGNVLELPIDEYIKINNISSDSVSFNRSQLKSDPFILWSNYPYITRDLSVWVKEEDLKNKLIEILESFAKKYCFKKPYKFDEFSKNGNVSLGYRFIFQSSEKNLTEKEVTIWWDLLIKEINKYDSFEIR